MKDRDDWGGGYGSGGGGSLLMERLGEQRGERNGEQIPNFLCLFYIS